MGGALGARPKNLKSASQVPAALLTQSVTEVVQSPARLTRRDALRGVGLAAVAALAAACALPRPGADQGATARSTNPTLGGSLRIGVLGDIPSLDPHQLTPPVPDVTYPIWDRLVELDARARPLPSLATGWESNPDDTELKLTLRQGVRYHSGRELTSDDVKWTFTRLQTDPIVSTTGFFSLVQPLSEVLTPDRYTVVLRSQAPWPGVFNLLSLMNVVDAATLHGPDAKTQAVGTGPFAFAEWVQGDHVRLVKNRAYWGTNQPRVDEIVVHVFRDPQALVTSLEAGAIDIADKPPLVDAARLRTDPRYPVLISDVGGTRYALYFNALVAPTNDVRFREGLLYAIDRQRIVDTVLRGIGTPRNLPFAATSPAYDAARDRRYTFDLTRAKSLVMASSVTDPTLDFNYSSISTEWAGVGQIYQADLAQIGVTLNLKPFDPVALVAALRARTFNGVMTGIVPLGAVSPTQQAFDPYYSPIVSFSGFTSDTLMGLADELQHTVDPARQPQVYARWSDYVLDQAWAGAVATSPPLAASTTRVHDLKYTQLEMLDYRDTWLD